MNKTLGVRITGGHRAARQHAEGGLPAASCSLILGDCMESVKKLPSASVDMVLMDPPYSTPTVASFGRQVCKRLSDLAIQEHYFGALKPEIERVLKPDGPLMIFCDDIYYAVLVGLFYDWKQINLLVWDKRKIGMGKPFRRRHECLFYANRGTPPIAGEMSHIPTILEHSLTKEHHGAEKPVALCEQMIRELTPEGGTVLDLFMGSGTTGVAAKNAGRHFIGANSTPDTTPRPRRELIQRTTAVNHTRRTTPRLNQMAKPACRQ